MDSRQPSIFFIIFLGGGSSIFCQIDPTFEDNMTVTCVLTCLSSLVVRFNHDPSCSGCVVLLSKVGDALIAISGISVQGVAFADIMQRMKTSLRDSPVMVLRFRTMEERYRLLRMKVMVMRVGEQRFAERFIKNGSKHPCCRLSSVLKVIFTGMDGVRST